MGDIIQFMGNNDLTPRQIVSELDKYIIGQKDAKKCVAIALRNRSRRKKLDPELQEEISPKNIIMIGPTGVGKTEIARRLSKLVNAPFIKVEITKYTEVGYVGRDVESMIRDLIAIAVNMVKKEYSTMVEEKALKNAYDKIVDIIIPKKGFEFDDRQVSGFHMERESIFESDTMYEQMRKQYLEDLKNGNLDDMEIEYESEMPNVIPVMSVMGGSGLEDIDMQIQSMLGDLMPKKSKRKKSTVKDALRIFITEETEKLIDMEKVTIEAVKRVEDMGIVFIDEIDKIAGAESKSGPDVSRQGVQRDLLPIIEGTTVNTKYGPIKTNHILFIAAGAFNVSKPSDLIPELQGRFPIRVELSSLSEEDFRKILTVPKNSLTLQYKELLKTEGVAIEFTRDGIVEIARIAQVLNDENENIGARRLHTIMEKLLEDILFDAPDLDTVHKNFTINADFVKNKLEPTIKNKDLSKYIL
ncbi:MAG TPA: ATP-dependent protease ATPase subunit HslU [Spirochaetota bacterium]|jgi:ATP-dependent HslUV protease ATP-binding subunit HslU|nr:ATP-dependent protease ATPase subunit HslU [Spirochaetota bacterium]HPD05315.1 ATP-dependent protease ATPase subunit HslU [Spirochaetota bacterium]HQG42367.1 ATP-dependent protease ATPase subunit HslU [Spirochaetota bacterium]HRR60570.1 ATP-dependent protease ATPase subunit HslU [Spirochaetota bacterium]